MQPKTFLENELNRPCLLHIQRRYKFNFTKSWFSDFIPFLNDLNFNISKQIKTTDENKIKAF